MSDSRKHKQENLARLFIQSCHAELMALKPSNVHVYREGHGMTVNDFIRSAELTAPYLTDDSISFGMRLYHAAQKIKETLNLNSNLGILLLCAPLLHAELTRKQTQKLHEVLNQELNKWDKKGDRTECNLLFKAIRLLSPSGLGTHPHHDVHQPARTSIVNAMRAAQEYDLIAKQYSHNFDDVIRCGHHLAQMRADGMAEDEAISRCFMRLLALHPDSHINRQHGIKIARAIQKKAQKYDDMLQTQSFSAIKNQLLAWDDELKKAHINAGTTADMVVASILYVMLTGEFIFTKR